MSERHWVVVRGDGSVAATAPTEGQAWLKALDVFRGVVDGRRFLDLVNFSKLFGARAEERGA